MFGFQRTEGLELGGDFALLSQEANTQVIELLQILASGYFCFSALLNFFDFVQDLGLLALFYMKKGRAEGPSLVQSFMTRERAMTV